MSRVEPLTQEFVSAACEKFVSDEIKPTLDKLRAEVGGSYNTLSRMLKVWKTSKQAETTAVFDMPESVMSAARVYTTEIWKQATLQAKKCTASLEEAAAEQVNSAAAEIEELSNATAQLEQELTTAKSNVKNLTTERDAAISRSGDQQAQITRVTAELESAKEHNARMEKQNTDLQSELINLARAATTGNNFSSR